MKYLRRINEGDEEVKLLEQWREFIEERLYYLTDEGFNLDDKEINGNNVGIMGNFVDDDKNIVNYFQKIHKSSTLSFCVTLIKEVETIYFNRNDWTRSSYENSGEYFLKDVDFTTMVYDNIDAFIAHFDNIYYTFKILHDKIIIQFIIDFPIDEDFTKAKEEYILNYKADRRLGAMMNGFQSGLKQKLTKQFKDNIRYFGSDKSGVLLYSFDILKLTTRVKNLNKERRLNYLGERGKRYFPEYATIEWKDEITKDDVSGYEDSNNVVSGEGASGILIKFDYDRWIGDIIKARRQQFLTDDDSDYLFN